jgi:hypothetical protein
VYSTPDPFSKHFANKSINEFMSRTSSKEEDESQLSGIAGQRTRDEREEERRGRANIATSSSCEIN